MAENQPSGVMVRSVEGMTLLNRLSLTSRILAVNLLPLALLGGGLFYIDFYRNQLISERFKLARIEAQITAEALAGASRERQEALMIQIGKEQKMRLRMYDSEGRLWADSFVLDEPAFSLSKREETGWSSDVTRIVDDITDGVVSAEPVPDYVDFEDAPAGEWPILQRTREIGRTQTELTRAADRTPVITAAAPVGLQGSMLMTTRNAVDITQAVRTARTTLVSAFALALAGSILLSLFLATTIVSPLRILARAAGRVRLGRDREVEVPRLPERKDEIGILARAVSDMTDALRNRIDAVEHFAADVAHEIKNPLASLRSAIESLSRVEDPKLRDQLIDIASHDVRRIDRLVTEISDASRVDAEISRTAFEEFDLVTLTRAIIDRRENRGENADIPIIFNHPMGPALVRGVPVRIERVIDNLLDNAVSFSPEGSELEVDIAIRDSDIRLSVCDQGPGIPEDSREKIFRRFHSIRPDAEEFGNHSGLGLAIAHTIVEAHGGMLTVQDRPDGQSGACLVLYLPIPADDNT